MKTIMFQEIIGNIDDDLIVAADNAEVRKKPVTVKAVFAVAAACIALVCAAVIAVPMFKHGGTITPPIEETTDLSDQDYTVIYMSYDWQIYDSPEEIVAASTNIFTGKIKSISFDVINMKTGKIDNSNDSDNADRMLYTIYTIDVLSSLKGENSGEIKICRIGGTPKYNEEEQYNVLTMNSLDKLYAGIPMILGNMYSLKIDDEYLFCTSRTTGDFDFIINQTQFAHKIDSEDCKSIIDTINKR